MRGDTGSGTRLRDIGFGPFRLLGLAVSLAMVVPALVGVGWAGAGPPTVPFPMTYPMPPAPACSNGGAVDDCGPQDAPTPPESVEPPGPTGDPSSGPVVGTLPTIDTVTSTDGGSAGSTALPTDDRDGAPAPDQWFSPAASDGGACQNSISPNGLGNLFGSIELETGPLPSAARP
jgi:hypothetical protein